MWPPLRYGRAMKPVPRWFVATCWAIATVFALSAGLQINDPDPVIWIVFYLAAGLAIGILPARRVLVIAPIAIGLIAAMWGGYLAYSVSDALEMGDLVHKMSEKGGKVEVGREAGGLLLVAVCCLGAAGFRATRA